MNISHHHGVGNNSRIALANLSNPHKTLDPTRLHNFANQQELHQKPHSQKITEPKAARLVHLSHDSEVAGFIDRADNADHDEQSLSALSFSKTITVVISFLKLSKYDDEWVKLGKQLLLLKKSPNKQKFYRSALCCFKSSIKTHPDNYVAYYFSGLTLCLLGQYAEAVRMFW